MPYLGVDHCEQIMAELSRRRRTQEELFLDTLKELSREGKLVGNTKLREKLNWEEAKHKRVKAQLVESHSIVEGVRQVAQRIVNATVD